MLTKPLPKMEHKRHATSALGKRKLDDALDKLYAAQLRDLKVKAREKFTGYLVEIGEAKATSEHAKKKVQIRANVVAQLANMAGRGAAGQLESAKSCLATA